MPADTVLLRPEHVLLRIRMQTTIDVGALCYLQRETTKEQGPRLANEGRKVQLTSLCPKRIEHIRGFISYISEEIKVGRNRPMVIYNITQYFSRFMAWADENGHSDVLDNVEATRITVIAYAAYIRERVASHAITMDYGAVVQRTTFHLLGEFLGIENLIRGINLLRKDSKSTPTVPPSEEDQKRTLQLCEAIFEGLTTLVLDEKPYPFSVSMPSYLGYPENNMWIFPSSIWCLPPSKLVVDASYIFNYRTGRINSANETMAIGMYSGKPNMYKQVFNRAKHNLSSANSDPLHWHRRFMGMMALNAFIFMFLSRTGMNWAQAIDLPWSGSFTKVATIRQKFRSIKHRAGGKEVYFQLPLRFMPFFKRFLELRDYLLQGYSDFDHLFFTMGNRSACVPTPLKSSLQITSKFLKRIDPKIVPVLSRAWRAAKSDWMISRTDVSTTAQILQNSERTVLKSYATGSVETHQMEMSAFLNRMVVNKGIVSSGSIQNSVGDCTSYGNPNEISGLIIVKPNCGRPEVGCLFCDKFQVHADEIDVRKLLSCRYCLTRTSHLTGFHAISEPLLEQIQLILNEVGSRDPLLVPRIAIEVEEGELDPYWARKYDMLLRLRLVDDTE